jgi:hypothetical protein
VGSDNIDRRRTGGRHPPIVVAEFDKNSREKIRITLGHFAGKDTIDVRIWYRDGDQLKPTRQGVTTAVSNLSALAIGIALALDKARELGLVD